MATKLTHAIRREIIIGEEPFTVVISPDGLRLSRKRFRSGRQLSWEALWQQGVVDDGDGTASESGPVPGDLSSV
jgi:hypothetical protein